jgi:hypothetical protein
MKRGTNENAQQSIVPLNPQDKLVQIQSHYDISVYSTLFLDERRHTHRIQYNNLQYHSLYILYYGYIQV